MRVCVCVYVEIWKLLSWDIFRWDVRVPSDIGVSQYILLNDGLYGVIQLCILVKVTHLLCYSSWGILTVYKCTSKVFIHYVFRMGWWAQYPCRMKELKYDHRCACFFPLNWSSHNIHTQIPNLIYLFIYLFVYSYMYTYTKMVVLYCTKAGSYHSMSPNRGNMVEGCNIASLFVFLSEWGLQFYTMVCEPLPP